MLHNALLMTRGVHRQKITPLPPIFLGFYFTSTAAANYYLDGTAFRGESTYPFLYIIIFQTWETFEPSSSTPVVDGHISSWNFCTKFNDKQLLFQTFFDVMHIFGSVEPQTESTFPVLYIIIFQKRESSKKRRIKVVRNFISYKKVGECIFPSPPVVELGGSKDQ